MISTSGEALNDAKLLDHHFFSFGKGEVESFSCHLRTVAMASSNTNLLALTLMGHVDHGKSSYADSLLASNGLISQRQAGKIRYLDSREDEQERGITIESSGVRLSFKMRRRLEDGGQSDVEDWTLNLIDTPGHIDFSSEVSTSSRLVDGCLIIVDVLEGVCTQTINVLRQAWTDRLKPILVLNKLDRLSVEVRMSPAEAEAQLQRVIEQANAVLAGFWAEERLQEEEREREEAEAKGETFTARVDSEDVEADAELYFDPARGNVIFASSLYGFAFRLHSFSHLYAKKLGLPEEKFRSFLWGDWYFDGKGKRMLNRKQATKLWGEGRLGSTACQQFVIENLWRVFEKTVIERDQAAIEKIVSTLALNVPPRELKTTDSHALLSSILSAWLPLAPCTFSTIVDQIPTPSAAQGRRVPRLLDPQGRVWKSELSRFYADKSGLERPQGRNDVEKHLFAAQRGSDAWRMAVISKMFAVAKDDLPTEIRSSPAAFNGDQAGSSREEARNMSMEERRRRAREAKERHEAARKAPEGETHTAATLAATGGPVAAKAVEPVGVPVDASQKAGNHPTNGVQFNLGSAPAVPLDVTYTKPTASTQTPLIAEPKIEKGSSEVLLAFVRVYSGSLKTTASAAQSPFFLLMPKYDTTLPASHASNQKHLKRINIEGLYVIMGKELVKVNQVQSGEICAVQGLEGVVGRMGTIVALPEASVDSSILQDETVLAEKSSAGFVNLTSGTGLATPIVRVALEPDNPSDLPQLIEGLRLLNQSDPCVQTLVQETGEHVIVTAGELHLERCLKDLRERFAKVPISASKPLVPFRETAIRVSEMAPPKFGEQGEARGTVNVSIANGAVKVKLRAKPLPVSITEFLEANTATVRALLDRRGGGRGSAAEEETTDVSAAVVNASGGSNATASTSSVVAPSQFFETLRQLLQKAGSSGKLWEQEWKDEDLLDRIWSFGPRRVGPNIFFGLQDAAKNSGLKARLTARAAHGAGSGLPTPAPVKSESTSDDVEGLTDALNEATISSSTSKSISSNWTAKDLLDSLDTGFQMATLQGPMCAEPVRGLAYFLEDLIIDSTEVDRNHLRLSQVSGSLISSIREACRNGLLDWSPRLMMAMYSCDVQAAPDVLGKVHAVLAKRRGKVISEEMKDGTSYFTIGAMLPVVESFGFADEVRKRTSGAASPQLVFKG